MKKKIHILVVGYGSVGQRHAQNLARRGAIISAVDTRPVRLGATEGFSLNSYFSSLDQALSADRYDAAVIATPTAFHESQAQALLASGCHVLLEKPVSLDSKSAERLLHAEQRFQRPILMGYTWRWWRALQHFRDRLKGGAIGRPLRADLVMASHLEDWHPGEPLSDFFMSSAALGGGALLDESHWIDQMLWLFGLPDEISGNVERLSALPIDSDDHVELNASYRDGLRVRIHLDLYTRPTERSISVFGDQGALRWSSDTNSVSEFQVGDADWHVTPFGGERNDMFDALAEEFLDICSGRAKPSCSLADGLAVMQVIEAIRESHKRKGAKIFWQSELRVSQ